MGTWPFSVADPMAELISLINNFAAGTGSEKDIHFPWKRCKVLKSTQDL